MVVLVPSRNRPASVARLLQAWADTGATAALVVLVDDDDPDLPGYTALDIPTLHIGARRRIGPLLNDWAPLYAATHDVVGFMGDDHVPRTPGWDQTILDNSTPWSVVYGDDLFQGQRIPTAVFMGSALIRELGYFNPPGCDHLFLDNAWKSYGTTLDTLTYLPDVVIEHVHYMANKATEDGLYREVNAPAMYDHDRAAYAAWQSGAAIDDLARVLDAMKESA
jgi:hypothetical protein